MEGRKRCFRFLTNVVHLEMKELALMGLRYVDAFWSVRVDDQPGGGGDSSSINLPYFTSL